jgi:myo-inositol-1(or 4)-monophosphatase
VEIKLNDIVPEIVKLVKQTGAYVKKERSSWEQKDVKSKDDQSLVTSLDVASEMMLVKGLKQILPEAAFLAEENHNHSDRHALMWIIDPIDGTTNFVHYFPMYCISLALWQDGKIVLGIIYEISGGECFLAYEGLEGAYLNEEKINVSEVPSVSKSLIATGFPSSGFEQIDEFLNHFRTFMTQSHGIRRLGSAAMDLAYLACGRIDGFFEYNLKPWDVAAGAYIVQKAGGAITDFNGEDNYIFGQQILASNERIHGEFLSYFKK